MIDNEKEEITPIVASFARNGFFINFYMDRREFWAFLGEKVGWGRFSCICAEDDYGSMFELSEVRQGACPDLEMEVDVRGVMWRRREALEAQRWADGLPQDLKELNELLSKKRV